jgi:hypothetical protein
MGPCPGQQEEGAERAHKEMILEKPLFGKEGLGEI